MPAPYAGFGGVAYNNTNAIAMVKSWTYSDELDTSQDGVKATRAKYPSGGNASGGGTIECLYAAGDTNGQAALTLGSAITLKLYVDTTGTGNTPNSGDPVFSGTVYITGRGVASPAGAGKATRSITYRGRLTLGVVT